VLLPGPAPSSILVPNLLALAGDLIERGPISQVRQLPVRFRRQARLKDRLGSLPRLLVLGGGGSRKCVGIPQPGVPATCRVTNHGCISGQWRFRFELDWARVDSKGKPLSGHAESTEEYPQEIKCPGPEGVS
jgi:hypothetical protein